MIGCAGAAEAAGIPEPEKVESLKPGGIYAVHYPEFVRPETLEHLKVMLQAESKRLGVSFIAMPEWLRLAKLDKS